MMKKSFILCLVCFSTLFLKAQTASESSATDTTLIVFASDTQAPMWVETILLKQHDNRKATKKVFNDIEKLRPGSVFLFGDVVNLGYSNRQWKPMDAYLRNLREKGITVDAVLGNHEVMGQPKVGEQKFQVRFPNHVRTGYVQIKDSVAIVLLNSNFKTLSKAEDAEQVAWYKKTLEQLDNDSAVQFIITTCHHSPFTNSKIVGSSKAVQDRFVTSFLGSKKSQLFLSGHCHGFEHYKIGGKDFMVIGGGGGLHQPLKQTGDILPDLAMDYKPLFHYLTVQRNKDGLQVRSLGLKPDFAGFEEGLYLAIKKTVYAYLASTTPGATTGSGSGKN